MSITDKFIGKTFGTCINILGEELVGKTPNALTDKEVRDITKAVVGLLLFVCKGLPDDKRRKLFKIIEQGIDVGDLPLLDIARLMSLKVPDISTTAFFGLVSKIHKATPIYNLSPTLNTLHKASFGGTTSQQEGTNVSETEVSQ